MENLPAAFAELRRRFRGPGDSHRFWLESALIYATRGERLGVPRKCDDCYSELLAKEQIRIPSFLQRYRTPTSMKRGIQRASMRQRRFTELFLIVDEFLAAMKRGEGTEFNGLLLEFANLYMNFQLNSHSQQ